MHSIRFCAPVAPFACAALIAAAFPLGVQAQSLPYTGTPIRVPDTFAAVHFDRGGQGVAYYDRTPESTGAPYRPNEGVDVTVSCDPAAGGYVVNQFQAGEWLNYTVYVPVAGRYDIEIRTASAMSTGTFNIGVDGWDVSGVTRAPNTGSWCASQWIGQKGVQLSAGTHVVRVVSNSEYFNLYAVRVSPSNSTPYSGTPVPIPATIEAENFDKGGEGVAYHDNVRGNAGGQYRTAEDVDIVASTDSAGGGYVISNFETGEWTKYTISVPTTGNYDLALRTATNFSTSAFHVEVDGVNVTGRVPVPSTGNWNTYQWVTGKSGLPLTAGTHVLKVVSDQQYFNLNSLRLTAAGSAAVPAASTSTGLFCSFGSSWTECGAAEQAKVPGRASIVNIGRDGGTAVRLHTEPGDSDVNGSGIWERNDLHFGKSSTYCQEGMDEWWAHSVLFPSDYVFPPGPGAGIVMDFHQQSSSGQANFELQTIPGIGLRLRGYGGPVLSSGQYQAVIPDPYGAPVGSVTRNVWYDFVYHAKWSSGSDGKMEAWLNGKKVLTYNGPTLYTGIACYFKLANYHAPFGKASSVIHDRVVRGKSATAVALTPLEGIQ